MDRDDYPRISLGSAQGWEKIKANYRSAVIASLEADIQADGVSNERAALLAHTNAYLDHIFHLAEPNLRVNGQNLESLNHEERNMEPFDEVLDRRIWSLSDTRLQWQKRIAETRSKLPSEVETQIKELLEEQRRADSAQAGSVSEDDALSEEEDTEQVPRYSVINDAFQAALLMGNELDQMMPLQEERAYRFQDVVADLNLKTLGG